MSLDTYTALKTSIADFLLRSDLTAVIPDFVVLAEAQMNRRLRTRRMVGRATSTLTGEFLALPTDFGGPRTMQVTSVDPNYVVPYLEPTELDEERNKYFSAGGQPRFYSVVGEEFQFTPAPDASYSLQLTYWERIASLSDSNTSNWLLTDHPDAYLYGSLVQAAPYLMDDPRLAVWGTLFTQALDDIAREDSQANYAGKLNLRQSVVF